MKRVAGYCVKLFLGSVLVVTPCVAAQSSDEARAGTVTMTGLITCSRCLDLSQHKGFTPWGWANYEVSQGDDIVLVVSGEAYLLQGDRKQLIRYLQDKETVTGYVVSQSRGKGKVDAIAVTNIAPPPKAKKQKEK